MHILDKGKRDTYKYIIQIKLKTMPLQIYIYIYIESIDDIHILATQRYVIHVNTYK